MSTPHVASHRTRTRTPEYLRQKSAGRKDRAFVELNGSRIMLGTWNSPESRQKYDRLIAEWLANNRTLPVETPKDGCTLLELMTQFWLRAESQYRGPDGKPMGELRPWTSPGRRRLDVHARAAQDATPRPQADDLLRPARTGGKRDLLAAWSRA